MSKVTVSPASLPFKLAPFTGVDNATVRLLKAISQFELNSLRSGDVVYVESVRDYWKWVPLSTATDDCTGAAATLRYCNPTVNGANPGRFERLFWHSPDWTQQDFFIDNILGANENSGAVGAPLNNDNELLQRWGTNAIFTIPVTVKYLQNPTTFTNYEFFVTDGGSVTVLGTPVVSQAAVTITGVTVLNRATPVGWAIVGATFGAGDVGKMAIIVSGTAANIGAYAYIVAQTGTTLTVSPFGKFTATIAGASFTQVTPAVNDVVQIVTPTTLKVGQITIKSLLYNEALNTPTRNCVVFDSVTLAGNANVGNSKIKIDEIMVFYARSIISDMDFEGFNGSFANHQLCGGGATNSIIIRSAAIVQTNQTGFRNAFVFLQSGGVLSMQADTYFQNSLLSTLQAGALILSNGVGFFNRSVADSTIQIQAGSVMKQSGAIPDWGTANAGHAIKVFSQGAYVYATKPTINTGLGAGRECLIGGTDKLLAAVPYIEGANGAALVLSA
jgi:hypothetical protein